MLNLELFCLCLFHRTFATKMAGQEKSTAPIPGEMLEEMGKAIPADIRILLDQNTYKVDIQYRHEPNPVCIPNGTIPEEGSDEPS